MPPLHARNLLTVLILGALATFSPFSLDLDAMRLLLPDMTIDLHGTAAKAVLGLYSVSLLASQLVFAPALNRFGTKTPFYTGLAVFVLASLGGLAFGAPGARLAFRLFQTLGVLAAQTAAMTMARRFFTPGREAREFTALILLLGASSTLIPGAGFVTGAGFTTGAGAAGAILMGWQWAFVLPAMALLAALDKAARKPQTSLRAAAPSPEQETAAPPVALEMPGPGAIAAPRTISVPERKLAAAAQPALRRRTAIPANSQYAYLPACRTGAC